MNRLLVLLAPLLFSISPSAAAQEKPAFETTSLTVYQAEILETVMPDVDQLTGYLDRLQDVAKQRFAAVKGQPGVSGSIVIAVKPGGKRRIWVMSPASIAPAIRSSIEAALMAQPQSMDLKGVFLIAINFDAWGGGENWPPNAPGPLPPEWERQIPPEGVMLDDAFLLKVWPD